MHAVQLPLPVTPSDQLRIATTTTKHSLKVTKSKTRQKQQLTWLATATHSLSGRSRREFKTNWMAGSLTVAGWPGPPTTPTKSISIHKQMNTEQPPLMVGKSQVQIPSVMWKFPAWLLPKAGSAMDPVGRLEPHSPASSTSRMCLWGCCSNCLTKTAGARVPGPA